MKLLFEFDLANKIRQMLEKRDHGNKAPVEKFIMGFIIIRGPSNWYENRVRFEHKYTVQNMILLYKNYRVFTRVMVFKKS